MYFGVGDPALRHEGFHGFQPTSQDRRFLAGIVALGACLALVLVCVIQLDAQLAGPGLGRGGEPTGRRKAAAQRQVAPRPYRPVCDAHTGWFERLTL